MGTIGEVPYVDINKLKFRVYTNEEIRKISVLEITNEVSLNQLGHRVKGGIYDTRLGPFPPKNIEKCETCNLYDKCQGHCGHIELPIPVYNPFFYPLLRQLVSHICLHCCEYQATALQITVFLHAVDLAKSGYIQEALEIEPIINYSNDDEAEEIPFLLNESCTSKANQKKNIDIIKLSRNIESYCKKAKKKNVECCMTSHVNGIVDTIRKQFFSTSKSKNSCIYCGKRLLQALLQNSRFVIKNRFDHKESRQISVASGHLEENVNVGCNIRREQTYITTEQILCQLKKCWDNNSKLLQSLYPMLHSENGENPMEKLFMHALLVPPPRYRPYNKLLDQIVEHETSVLYKNIVQNVRSLKMLIAMAHKKIDAPSESVKLAIENIIGTTIEEKCQTIWYQIQGNVDNIFDSTLNPLFKTVTKGIKQVIEKKEGLFRQNLMGKRVNFSARSVAAPDPYLSVDEVGVPELFAKSLSYPVPVTPWNIDYLRKLIINGPLEHPGAVAVEDEEGKKLFLTDNTQRLAIAKMLGVSSERLSYKKNTKKIVYRHLIDGDYVLMNRQPTLHKPSIQAHRAHVMPNDRVLRMPYANCKAYNADFDGDELNLHFPQNELARSELKYLITTKNQYLTPKDGGPLGGLIQDCVVSSVMLTTKGKFFDKEDYFQLVFVALSDYVGAITFLPPSIMKPKMLWSGKQIISTIIINVISSGNALPSFTTKTTVKAEMWIKKKIHNQSNLLQDMTEAQFIMREGELLSGVVDKSAIGSSSFGLIHICYDLYGGDVATNLLTAFNRLLVYYLQWSGHTIGVKEFCSSSSADCKRRGALSSIINCVPVKVAEKLSLTNKTLEKFCEQAHLSENEKELATVDAAYTSVLGPYTSEITGSHEKKLYRRGLDNHMKMMIDTGSKGSKVNMNQMASLFGSMALDGKRMRMSAAGRTLPSFTPYDTDPRAGGYVPYRFMTGMDPRSYFFLCIVGRDSMQHTAVKTASSGYMQRCLIKHLEGVHVKYDSTVRNSDGLVLQFEYGEDGLDVTKVPFLGKLELLDVLADNYHLLQNPEILSMTEATGQTQEVLNYFKKIRKWKKKCGSAIISKVRRGPFLSFSSEVGSVGATVDADGGYNAATGRSNHALSIQSMWLNMSPEERMKYEKAHVRRPDPVDSVFSASSTFGVVSEAIEDLIEKYYKERYSKRPLSCRFLDKEKVSRNIKMKVFTSRIDPGEAVGALCAQAIGEPLTQMTLNTFHFAGKDELNVTLGVPRMIEILRSASEKISTPIMEIPFHSFVTREQAEAFKMKLAVVPLEKVLNKIEVTTSYFEDICQFCKKIKVKFLFLPHKQYKHMFFVKPQQIINFMEKTYIKSYLIKIIKLSYKSVSDCFVKVERENLLEQEKDENGNNGSADNGSDAESDKQYFENENRSDEVNDDDEEDDDEEEEEEEEGDEYFFEENYSKDEMIAEDKVFIKEDGAEEVLDTLTSFSFPAEEMTESKSEVEYGVALRTSKVKEISELILDYSFDAKKYRWCELVLKLPLHQGKYDVPTIIRQTSKTAFVSCIPGIKRAFVVEKDGNFVLRTEGANIKKMLQYDKLLNLNKLYTNNIHAVAENFGIEAAQRSIIRELREVQSAYNITITLHVKAHIKHAQDMLL